MIVSETGPGQVDAVKAIRIVMKIAYEKNEMTDWAGIIKSVNKFKYLSESIQRNGHDKDVNRNRIRKNEEVYSYT